AHAGVASDVRALPAQRVDVPVQRAQAHAQLPGQLRAAHRLAAATQFVQQLQQAGGAGAHAGSLVAPQDTGARNGPRNDGGVPSTARPPDRPRTRTTPMTTLTDDIFSQLSGPALQQISQQLGTGQAQTAGAISAALPMILGAMGRNASQPQGAEALL